MRPNNNFLILAILPLLFLFTSCNQDAPGPTRNYHRINTNQVSNIGSASATLSAEIIHSGPEPILDHGFVWGKTKPFTDPKISYIISLGSRSGTGEFRATIDHSFERATSYYVRPYIRTENTVVYGNMVAFKGSW